MKILIYMIDSLVLNEDDFFLLHVQHNFWTIETLLNKNHLVQ